MRVLQVTTEAAGIAKVGGIGDYILGLTHELLKQSPDLDLHIALPLYGSIDKAFLASLSWTKTPLSSTYNLVQTEHEVWSAPYKGATLHLFKINDPNNFFNRKTIYGDKDDILRFLQYSILVLQFLKHKELAFDVVHLHDWLTAFIAPLFKERYLHLGVQIKSIITTIHNAGYQGVFPKQLLQNFSLCSQAFDSAASLQDIKQEDHFNLLKGALIYSDGLTTVSPTYAQEIQTHFGFGLESYFKKFQNKLTPILNGIDTDYWNIATDPLLNAKAESLATTAELLSFKQTCKASLLKKLNIPDLGARPLFCTVTRLVEQKGPELIAAAIDHLAEQDAAFVLLGSPMELKTTKLFEELKDKHKSNPFISFNFGFDEALAHEIFASSDFTLVPSIFEPCGLTQMIALRYGCLPIVHHIGGLKDTIHDAAKGPVDLRNGYSFKKPDPGPFKKAIDRALHDFLADKKLISEMIHNGFSHDWSWSASAKKHLELYEKLATPASKAPIA